MRKQQDPLQHSLAVQLLAVRTPATRSTSSASSKASSASAPHVSQGGGRWEDESAYNNRM